MTLPLIVFLRKVSGCLTVPNLDPSVSGESGKSLHRDGSGIWIVYFTHRADPLSLLRVNARHRPCARLLGLVHTWGRLRICPLALTCGSGLVKCGSGNRLL